MSIAGEPNSRVGLRRLHLRGDAASTDGVTRVGVGRLSRLFLSLFDVSTLDSGPMRPQPEPISLGDLRAAVMAQNTEAARRAGVDPRLVPTRLHVEGDAGLITTIVQNLVSNALKYARGRRC